MLSVRQKLELLRRRLACSMFKKTRFHFCHTEFDLFESIIKDHHGPAFLTQV